jgi:hypothetical protein
MVLWAIFLGLAAVLIVGAIRRTQDVQNRSATDSASGQGHGRSENVVIADEETGPRQGNSQGAGNAQADDAATVNLTRTVQASVIAADDSVLTLAQDGGAELLVEGQPWAFALAEGFIAQVGEAVAVSGFDADGEFKATRLENLSTGQVVILRDEAGRPGWAGHGRRGN